MYQKEDTAELVSALCFKNYSNYSLAILSNIDLWHYEFCEENYSVLQKFNRKFLSFQLKMKKPDPQIYYTVANQLEVTPEQCLLIDDLIENIESAQSSGFDVIHFKNADQLHADLSAKGIVL